MKRTVKESQRRFSHQGFTLLELLIAMALLVLIISITMGAMRLASRSVATGEKRAEDQERFRTVMSLMDAQIQSQLPLTHGAEGNAEGNKANYFQGSSKNLRMTTSYSLWGGRRGSVIVDYRVETDREGKETLYADEQTPEIEGKREARLFADASEISFEYFRKESADAEGQWTEQWTDETAIPAGIRLHVNYGAKKLLFLFPLRARGETVSVPMTPFSLKGASTQ